jgi:hypothetical protein
MEGLHKLAGEFEGANEGLRDEIGGLQVELEGARTELEAERKAAEEERLRLSNTLAELVRLEHDDNVAAKMVSRYMYVQFSPTSSPPKTRILPPQEVLPSHNGHTTKSARVPHRAPRGNDIHAAYAARFRTGRARH